MRKIKQVTGRITEIDSRLIERAQERLNQLTKPLGSLGRLEELAKQIVGITGEETPNFKNKVIFTLAADHGIAEEKVSAYPKEVTAQMVYNFLKGGAGINVLAGHIGARVVIVDMGVCSDLRPHPRLIIKKINYGTRNMAKGPAMSRAEAIMSVEAGIAVFEHEFSANGVSVSGGKNGIDIIGTGEMGIGNTTASSAITAVFTGAGVKDVTGRGTGVDDKTLKNKIELIKKALKINAPNPRDPIGVLAKVGGFEIGGLAGIIMAAASRRVPVVIDGFISGAAALLAYHLQPRVKGYMIAGHCSVEKGHRIILGHIGLNPLLDLELRLGEGTGAALGINIAEAAIKILTRMATFKSANVSERGCG